MFFLETLAVSCAQALALAARIGLKNVGCQGLEIDYCSSYELRFPKRYGFHSFDTEEARAGISTYTATEDCFAGDILMHPSSLRGDGLTVM